MAIRVLVAQRKAVVDLLVRAPSGVGIFELVQLEAVLEQAPHLALPNLARSWGLNPPVSGRDLTMH